MKFRTADTGDAQSIVRLINLAFQVERFFVETDRISRQEVESLLGKGSFLLAEDDGGLAACVYLELRGDRAYFGLLSVDPSRQRTGLGGMLIGAAEDCAREAGCRFMDLQMVNLRVELPALYRKFGYKETGTAPFPGYAKTKMPCHFILMSKPLE
jgi:GNAT superfamily N-acetyltransferase